MPDRVNLNDEDPDLYEQKGGNRKENRESAQEKVDNAVREAGLSKNQRKKLHDRLGQDYMEYSEILEIAYAIKAEDE
ncbi:MAG: hypothetical protein HC785_05990 [Calothrix sp. CSU_2_0]|nr:hypothetical protein [Calothrix sp. CSU_2_0]